ncbi:MAG TPA: glycosyltransferase [Candidatus Sulfotelmatobacter sp.]|jgi:cellulose synthase (UDP-forming)|nr:glycosyltransferase [Candidatus Sulfotelmatobacter sp.]
MHNRPRKIQNTALLFLILAPLTMLYYASYIFNPLHAGNILLYLIQLVADTIAIINITTLWITILLDIIQTDHHRSGSTYDVQWLGDTQPTVDVLIPVANEPLEIIAHTLSNVSQLDYPHITYLLDDGTTDEAKKLAKKYHATYIKRPQEKKSFAKSGNLNYGLTYCHGDFVAIFDADHAPEKTFLSELLPFFKNSKVGLVQTPQFYTNTDKFIAAGTSQAQEVFYKYIQPAKNSYNASFCVGTNMIYRRTALDTIGGIALCDHTEDLLTSIRIHENGYQSIFYNKVLAKGRAPETIPAFFRQQNRWSRGGFLLFFTHNPLFLKSLTIDQRLQYFFSNIHYFTTFSILVYLLIPIIYLFFGVYPMNLTYGQTWLIHYLPYFLMVYFMPFFLLGKLQIATISTSLASFSPYLKAFLAVILKNKYQWVATETQKKQKFLMNDIWPHLLIIFLSLASVYVGWYHVQDIPTTLYASIWTLINSYMLFIFIVKGMQKENDTALEKVSDESN